MKNTASSRRRLVQVASVAIAVSRAENIAIVEALQWLLQMVEAGHLQPRLFQRPTHGLESGYSASSDESVSRWRAIVTKAEEIQFEDSRLPSAAGSWCVHSDDLAALSGSGEVSDRVGRELLDLVKGTLPRGAQPEVTKDGGVFSAVLVDAVRPSSPAGATGEAMQASIGQKDSTTNRPVFKVDAFTTSVPAGLLAQAGDAQTEVVFSEASRGLTIIQSARDGLHKAQPAVLDAD